MSHSDNQSPTASTLRLLRSDGEWLEWNYQEKDEKVYRERKEKIQEPLLSSLNATNLIVLLGSGASLAAKNAHDKQAPKMSDLWKAAKQSVNEEKFKCIIRIVFGEKNEQGEKENIELLLSLCKMRIELNKAQGKGSDKEAKDLEDFVNKAEQAILDQVDFVTGKIELEHHKKFLRRLARRSTEKSRVKLFTTNYDRCIEEAAARLNLVLIDGFSHSVIQQFNRDHFQQDIVRRSTSSSRTDYIDGVFHLYKLHGSMDWRRRKSDRVVIRSMKQDEDHEPVLIYPRSSKYQETFAPPYLDLFSAWQMALREPDTTLIVSGFGFADDHISATIWSALESNLSMRLIICDPCFKPVERNGETHALNENNAQLNSYQQRILHLLSVGDNRINILDGCFSDLALALPDISGQTDRQRLEHLLQHIRGPENADK